MRLRLDLSYDGSAFHGWARQNHLRTVQGDIEIWLSRLLGEQIPLTVAGRTDAGVHALGQVAHIDVDDMTDIDQLKRRLRRVLPNDIVLQSLSIAPEGFDARFSAIWRLYRYRIWDRDSHIDPLQRHMVTSVDSSLDIDQMNRAGAMLLGLRNFAPFCKKREGATTIRTLMELTTHRLDDGMIVTTVKADAFCHSMVRSLMGALTAIGSGRRDLNWLEVVSSLNERAGDIHVMAARGLCLEQVGYPDDDRLAERARESRSMRTLPELPCDCD